MADPTDFELMRQIQARERRAHFILKDRYQKRIYEIAYATCHDPHQAQSVIQKVFEYCWQKAEVFDLDHDRSVALWLYELAAFYARKVSDPAERAARSHSRLKSDPGDSAAPPPKAWLVPTLALSLLGISGYAGFLTWQFLQGRPDPGTSEVQAIQTLYTNWQQQPNIQRMTLRDPKFRSDVLAQALWSPTERKLIVAASQFPPSPLGRAYQVWVVSRIPNAQGQLAEMTESAGVFNRNADGSVLWLSGALTTITPQRLWVTLEPGAGSSRPNGPVIVENNLQTQIQ